MDKLFGRASEIASYHAIFPIEEDVYILRQAGLGTFYIAITSDEESVSDSWILNLISKNFAYDYHETFLRILNSVDAPRSHWLLKAPIHSVYLDTLLRHYPHAVLLMVHRRLDEVLPSYCQLMRYFYNLYFEESDLTGRDASTRRAIQVIDKFIKCIVEFHTRPQQLIDEPYSNIFHVLYDDLMGKQIATVRRIYDHFGLPWSEEFEAKMRIWLRDNPQGKQGRHAYSLTEFGLTREDIEQRYANYIELFLRSSPLGVVNSDQHASNDTQVQNA
ncbi:unnamed protein product [Didymodactylos carnosus]|uniref:Sulfotransferase n=1 Tax=Didymodactylos carnosus TaxID=1234261 RepID=A0A8S2K563_9BILA|nr:unnamed protein product [Didymodactylos carnosus]CAF3839276.1 unnamed protein product [Didymodactylos carnosus]